MEEKITEAINDRLESEKYSLKFYLGSIPPDELERARQDALNTGILINQEIILFLIFCIKRYPRIG